MFALTLSFFLVSCGAKKDEALVTDFNSKKTEADKMIAQMGDASKMMMTDHAAWTAKLDDAAKLPKADTVKIAGFKAAMKKMEDDGKAASPWIDSLKAYENAKTDNNDQLKAAIAGLDATLAKCNTTCNGMMDAHKKLGADITAFLGGAPAAPVAAEPAAKTGAKTAPAKTSDGMDATKHSAVKVAPTGTARRGGGAVIKQ